MGMVIFGALALYLIVSLVVVGVTALAAKSGGRSPWRWGGAAAAVMYLLVFWDHVPTVMAHKYYCEKDAGFWINKTMAQWKSENIGVAETLTPVTGAPSTRVGDQSNRTYTYPLNQRFVWSVKKEGPYPFHRWRHEQQVVDVKTSESLAQYVDFSTGYGELALGGEDTRVLKFWLRKAHCNGGASNEGKMGQFMLQAKVPAKGEK